MEGWEGYMAYMVAKIQWWKWCRTSVSVYHCIPVSHVRPTEMCYVSCRGELLRQGADIAALAGRSARANSVRAHTKWSPGKSRSRLVDLLNWTLDISCICPASDSNESKSRSQDVSPLWFRCDRERHRHLDILCYSCLHPSWGDVTGTFCWRWHRDSGTTNITNIFTDLSRWAKVPYNACQVAEL